MTSWRTITEMKTKKADDAKRKRNCEFRNAIFFMPKKDIRKVFFTFVMISSFMNIVNCWFPTNNKARIMVLGRRNKFPAQLFYRNWSVDWKASNPIDYYFILLNIPLEWNSRLTTKLRVEHLIASFLAVFKKALSFLFIAVSTSFSW